MTADEALEVVETVLDFDPLSKVQGIVFREAWQGKSYSEIAHDTGYDPDYVKDVGAKLWKRLSEEFGERVKKDNLEAVIRRYLQRHKVNIQRNLVIEVNLSGADLSGANLTGSRLVANLIEYDASETSPYITTYAQNPTIPWQNLSCSSSVVASLADVLEDRNIDFVINPQLRWRTEEGDRHSYRFDLMVYLSRQNGAIAGTSQRLCCTRIAEFGDFTGH